MNPLRVLVDPRREDLEFGDGTLLCSAASVLQVGEFQLLQLAYASLFDRELPEALVDRLFASYMLRNEVPYWTRHFARALLAEDDAGHLDPEHRSWHRHDCDYCSDRPRAAPPLLPARPKWRWFRQSLRRPPGSRRRHRGCRHTSSALIPRRGDGIRP